MKKVLLTVIMIVGVFFGVSSAADAWQYSTAQYNYLDNGQLVGTCPNGICVGKAAKIVNDSDEAQRLDLELHYGEKIGNYQWGEDHNGAVIWHEIPMSVNNWSRAVPVGKNMYFRVVLREQHPTTFQWLAYYIASTPAVSHMFPQDGGGVYYIFPPNARYYNHNFEKDIYGYVMIAKNSLGE